MTTTSTSTSTTAAVTMQTVDPSAQVAVTETAVAVVAVPTTPTAKVRRPAKELMAERKRLTFGQAFVNAVLAGAQRDDVKVAVFGELVSQGTLTSVDLLALSGQEMRDTVAKLTLEYTGTLPQSYDMVKNVVKTAQEALAETAETAAEVATATTETAATEVAAQTEAA